MLKFKLSRIIIVASFPALLLNSCTATRTVDPGRETIPAAEKPQATMEVQEKQPAVPAPLPPAEIEQESTASPGVTIPAPAFEPYQSPATPEALIDYEAIEFAQGRLQAYENKFDRWLEISEMVPQGVLADELTALEIECVQQLERVLSAYSLLLESLQAEDPAAAGIMDDTGLQKLQQLDIGFLESRCNELLTMDIAYQDEFIPAAEPELSFAAAQEAVITHVAGGDYQDALFAYGRLAQDFPEQKPSLATRLHYGLALQYTGQVEAAARHFRNMLDSGDLSIAPLSLQREIGDLFFAAGDVAAAESYYESVILGHEAITAEKTWAEEQLVLLRTVAPESAAMTAYMKLLREFQMYDYRIHAPRLHEAINAFAAAYAGSPVAANALRLKSLAADRLKAWFGRQLVKVDTLVAEKKFTEATAVLQNMTGYYLPAELQAVLQKTYYETAQAEIQETEKQRRMQEMELTEQWDAAVNLLDSQRYDLAIAAFKALHGTEYEERAGIKLQEAANLAAGQMRKEAAGLFIRAGKAQDLEQKKELLLASHSLLREILTKYPQTDLLDKVQQNIAILEQQIRRFDPALLHQPPPEDQAEPSAGASGFAPGQNW